VGAARVKACVVNLINAMKPEIYLSTDVKADGPIPGAHSISSGADAPISGTATPPQSTLRRFFARDKKRALRSFFVLISLVATAICTLPRWLPLRQARLYFPCAVAWYRLDRRTPRSPMAAQIVGGARAQIGTRYDASYLPIAYPLGDVPADRGACTDVVIRALRPAGFDLQRLIHQDIVARPAAYPQIKAAEINANIDHRRVPNQMIFLRAQGRELTRVVAQSTLEQWQPGDIVYWRTGASRLHTGVISDGVDNSGVPLVIHNGSVCAEDNCLTRWPIIGHFRFPVS
jgi:uncharacterized protein YijF (DUF1287 family)